MKNDAEIYFDLEFSREKLPPIDFSFTGFLKGMSNFLYNLAICIEEKQYVGKFNYKYLKEGCQNTWRMCYIDVKLKDNPLISFDEKYCDFIVDGHRFTNIDQAERAAKMKVFL